MLSTADNLLFLHLLVDDLTKQTSSQPLVSIKKNNSDHCLVQEDPESLTIRNGKAHLIFYTCFLIFLLFSTLSLNIIPAYHRKQQCGVRDPLGPIQHASSCISCTYISHYV